MGVRDINRDWQIHTELRANRERWRATDIETQRETERQRKDAYRASLSDTDRDNEAYRKRQRDGQTERDIKTNRESVYGDRDANR